MVPWAHASLPNPKRHPDPFYPAKRWICLSDDGDAAVATVTLAGGFTFPSVEDLQREA